MKNCFAICAVSRQLTKIFHRIETLTNDIEPLEENKPELVSTYEELRFGELEQAQVLVLELTRLITDADVGDSHNDEGGSAFAAGDLTAVKAGELEGIEPPSTDKE